MSLERVSLGADDHLVFLHVLKTAGQTLMPILEHNFEAGESLFANWGDLKAKSREELNRYRLIMGHNYQGIRGRLTGNAYFMTFLRDPIDRTLSHYYYLKRYRNHHLQDKLRSMDLEAFLRDPETRAEVENLQTRWLASEDGLMRADQVDEGTLEKARQRLSEFSFVGVTEQFDNSLFLLAYTFGWRPVTEYEVKNKANNRPEREELSPAVRELMEQVNALDIQLYDFASELFQQRFKGMQQDLLSSSRTGFGGSLPVPPEIEKDARTREQEKWDEFYRNLPLSPEGEASKKFSQEFAGQVSELLNEGGRVLELGAGGGWQSLALARTGRFETDLMDFSPEALRYAERLFEREGQKSGLLQGDAFASGQPEYDLVFNLGSLEHYTFEDQVAFLKGMASRSRKFVLALVPNQSSYWYWIWRVRNGGLGQWSFGKEVPMLDLERAFREAGLTFMGQKLMGQSWTESFLYNLPGMDDELRHTILRIHQSDVSIPEDQKAYLVAGLGMIPGHEEQVRGWDAPAGRQEFDAALANAAIADALALQVSQELSLEKLRHALESKNQLYEVHMRDRRAEIEALTSRLFAQKAELDELARTQRAELDALGRRLEEHRLAGEELNARAAEAEMRAKQLTEEAARWAAEKIEAEAATRRLAEYESSRMGRFVRWVWRLRLRLVPHGSAIERMAAWALGIARKVRGRISRWRARRATPILRRQLARILREHADPREVVVFAPSVEWDLPLFQRPQQMAKAFARDGALVFYCEPEHSGAQAGCVEILPNLYRCNFPVEELRVIPSPAVVVFAYNERWLKAFDRPRVIYEYIDDLSVFPYDQSQLQESHNRLLQTADVVVATAKRLHDEVLPSRADALLNPNGVDYLHFARVREKGAKVPEDLQPILKRQQPVIGYYGALAKWFDYGLLQQAAAARPNYQFVLIGPDYDGSLPQSGVLNAPNVYWLGLRKYNDLPDYLACFDTAMIPFCLNDITHSTSPLKLFEFMSAHKPVVITAMHESMRAEGVLVADNPDEFCDRLDEALTLKADPHFLAKIDREALKNTWDERAEEILSALKSSPRSQQ
jgi:glycosyltransferase involved in cell wall biosynthesis/SAM-dependent methyltransferase